MTTIAKTLITKISKSGENVKALTGYITGMSAVLDKIAAICMFSIMGLVVTNVISRTIFKQPILGAYEYVGFLTAVMIGLSLAHCAVKKGHIAVDFIMNRFSVRTQAITSIFTNGIALLFWSFSAWHMAIYAYNLSLRGVVSSTAQVPYYYFIYLIAFGLLALSLVILLSFNEAIEKALVKK